MPRIASHTYDVLSSFVTMLDCDSKPEHGMYAETRADQSLPENIRSVQWLPEGLRHHQNEENQNGYNCYTQLYSK